ncbi:MAG: hypothetical protein CMH34_08785 [Microbacterium sp.]|nr:hypothetical protein [Microbacterium sp.]
MTTIPGLYNYRDLGGLPTTDGRTTRPGVLARSESLSSLDTAGLSALAETPVGVIADFRTPAEQQAAPDRLPPERPFTVLNLPLLQGAMADMMKTIASGSAADAATALQELPTLDQLYISMLDGGAAVFAQAARRVAASHDDSPTGVLVHCTAGKDRTGVATALILETAGVQRDATIADYAQSQENLAGPWAEAMIREVEAFGIPITPSLRTMLCGTPPAAIEQAMDWVDEHGGATAYLMSGGLTEPEVEALRARLVA